MSVFNGKEKWLLRGNQEDQKYDILGTHVNKQTNKHINFHKNQNQPLKGEERRGPAVKGRVERKQ